jgi:hypothetical protein
MELYCSFNNFSFSVSFASIDLSEVACKVTKCLIGDNIALKYIYIEEWITKIKYNL